MGGIAGILHLHDGPGEADVAALGPTARRIGPHAALSTRPRSTSCVGEELVTAVVGHFDRVSSAGLSAAEVLADSWRSRGPAALEELEGAWVGVVYEPRERRLHLLRDAFGIRRLYFSWRSGRIAFSSKLRTLLDLSWVSRELARENLAEYLSFRYVHGPRTLLRDVYALPAGAHASFDDRGLSTRTWHRLRYAAPFTDLPDDRTAVAETERRLNRAVAARASGRGRVGVFLSGGLDSSAITATAARLGAVHTFTLGIADAEEDEAPYAGRVATILRTHHHLVRVSQEDFSAMLPKMVATADAPIPDPAAVPQAVLAAYAAEHVDVVLCGDGGDEIFGGRMVGLLASQMRLSAWLRRLPTPGRKLAAAAFGAARPELAQPGMPFGLARLIGGTRVFGRDDRGRLMRDPGWQRPGIRRACLEPFYREVVTDPVNEILHVYLRGRMVEDSLCRTGAAAACVNLGVRAPLLDRELVSWLASLPGPYKVRSGPSGGITKWPLRQMLRPVLSRGLVNRPKRVLPAPWGRWFAGPLAPFLDERVASLCEDPLKLWIPEQVRRIAGDLAAPGADAKLWVLILLDLWMRDLRVT